MSRIMEDALRQALHMNVTQKPKAGDAPNVLQPVSGQGCCIHAMEYVQR